MSRLAPPRRRFGKVFVHRRGEKDAGDYEDVPGFCKSASIEEVQKQGHVLTPGRNVGAEPQEEDGEPFEEKIQWLIAQLAEQTRAARVLDKKIARDLEALGFRLPTDHSDSTMQGSQGEPDES